MTRPSLSLVTWRRLNGLGIMISRGNNWFASIKSQWPISLNVIHWQVLSTSRYTVPPYQTEGWTLPLISPANSKEYLVSLVTAYCYLQQAQESMGWRKKFCGGRITCYQDLSCNPLGLKILMQIFRLIAIHSLKNKLGEFDNGSKNFSIDDHFVSSPKLSLWLSIDI